MKPQGLREFVRARMAIRLKAVNAQLRRAARSPEDPEAVHDLRVAIRRFTQCLRTFASCLDEDGVKKIRGRLRRLMDRCGETRNYDIALELMRECGLQRSPAAEDLKLRRKHAERALLPRLKRWRGRNILGRWKHKLKPRDSSGGEWDLRQSATDNARRVLPDLAAALFTAGDRAAASGTNHLTIHQFRLQVKRYRYTLEIFEPVYGPPVTRQLQRLRSLQDRLGRINDCASSMPLVKGYRGAAIAIGKLLDAREKEFRSHWMRQFREPSLRAGWVEDLANPGPHKKTLSKYEAS